jgi:hypothetical protein|tara:strand:- start:73 stop:570 length:498 start_codon:yes stop_codon:yes gene_type:complete
MSNHLSIYSVNNFKNHKNNLITLIKQTPSARHGYVSYTDWNSGSHKRPYVNYFVKNIFNDYAKHFCRYFKIKKIELVDIWFQIYKKGDYHLLHTHENAHFANVFYINLPHKKLKTKVYSLKEKELKFKCKEGDIVSFPAFYRHGSSINNYEEEKIIISFNTNIRT